MVKRVRFAVMVGVLALSVGEAWAQKEQAPVPRPDQGMSGEKPATPVTGSPKRKSSQTKAGSSTVGKQTLEQQIEAKAAELQSLINQLAASDRKANVLGSERLNAMAPLVEDMDGSCVDASSKSRLHELGWMREGIKKWLGREDLKWSESERTRLLRDGEAWLASDSIRRSANVLRSSGTYNVRLVDVDKSSTPVVAGEELVMTTTSSFSTALDRIGPSFPNTDRLFYASKKSPLSMRAAVPTAPARPQDSVSADAGTDVDLADPKIQSQIVARAIAFYNLAAPRVLTVCRERNPGRRGSGAAQQMVRDTTSIREAASKPISVIPSGTGAD